MTNYHEIVMKAITNITGKTNPSTYITTNPIAYQIAIETAKLQAENYNKAIDDSYIQYLEEQNDYS